MSDTTVGIDFGTTTTLVAFYGDGEPELLRDPAADVVRDPEDDEIIPSYISFHPNGQTLAGRLAKARRRLDATNTVHSFKRIIGLSGNSSEYKQFRKWYPAELKEDASDTPRFITRGGELSAVDIASKLFSYLNEQPQIAAAKDGAVITVPPSFREEQGPAVKSAAEQAGFGNIRLLSEPYAAALPYVTKEKREKVVVVYDLGGGTFDLAVLRCDSDSHEVLGFGGDPYLGGEDIDLRLADWIRNEVLAKYQWDLGAEKDTHKKLIWASEQAKVRLSSEDETDVLLTQVDAYLAGKAITVQRPYLEKLLFTLAQQTFVLCDEVLDKANVAAREVDEVVLAGGGCYIPWIRNAVRDYFGREPRVELPPDKLVAIGASIAAATGIGS